MNSTSTAEFETAASTPLFSVLDPTLPLLAAKAAMQLDRLRVESGGKPAAGRIDAVEKLQGMLCYVTTGEGAGGARSLVDPLSLQVLSDSISEHNNPVGSLEDLWKRLGELLRVLDPDTVTRLSAENLLHLRDFFLALSNYSAAGQQSMTCVRPTTTYRK